MDGRGGHDRPGRARRAAGQGAAGQRPAGAAAVRLRAGGAPARGRAPAVPRAGRRPGHRQRRCRCSAAWPASRAGTPARWSCTRRAWPSPRPPVTGGRSRAPTATWASPPGCSATSSGPPRSARPRWSMFRELVDVEGIAWSLLSLGAVARYQGDREQAAALLAESRSLSERIGFREGIAWSLEQLGLLAIDRGDPARRGRCCGSSLDVHRELRDRWRTCSVLEDLARAGAGAGRARCRPPGCWPRRRRCATRSAP